jgi:hypothetical protein
MDFIWCKGGIMANTYQLIEAKTLNSNQTSITFSSIPQTYIDLLIKASTRNLASNSSGINIYLNSTTPGSQYTEVRLYGTGSATGSDTGNSTISISTQGGGGGYTANTFGNTEIYIPDYTSSNYKMVSADGVPENDATATLLMLTAGLRSNTAAVTSVILEAYESSFVSGSTFYLYGIKNS